MPLHAGDLDAGITGTLHGYWGFQAFDGPTFHLQNARPAKWVLASEDANALIVGRQDAFHLQSEKAPCVDQVTMKDQRGNPLKATWKLLKANRTGGRSTAERGSRRAGGDAGRTIRTEQAR